MDQPNPIRAFLSIATVLMTTRRPDPRGQGTFVHSGLVPVLETLREGQLAAVAANPEPLSGYLAALEEMEPDSLARSEALAYWLNLYNGLAIRLASDAYLAGLDSVLRIPGAFSTKLVEVGGEKLSLDAIEHAKIRRFGDPRIHSALVCGSISCPTVRYEPFAGDRLDEQLDDQMRRFLGAGGVIDMGDTVLLSRVFFWYGGDFVRPGRMPTFLPAGRGRLLESLQLWMPPGVGGESRVEFNDYDWGLGCAVS